ncbi:hypothetical protein ACNKHU_24845 [Shigella flexneri]
MISRHGDPTRDVVQRALAELEGGAGAVLTDTGRVRDSPGNDRFLKQAMLRARLLRR